MEHHYVEMYREQGYNILNKAKTGVKVGAIGMASNHRWTHDACIEARKYETRNEFRLGSPSAYTRTVKNKWIDECTWFIKVKEPTGYWNDHSHCYAEAQKYEYLKDFIRYSDPSYRSALHHGWSKDYVWLKIPQIEHWTEERCYQIALNYEDSGEFYKHEKKAYNAASSSWLVKKIMFG